MRLTLILLLISQITFGQNVIRLGERDTITTATGNPDGVIRLGAVYASAVTHVPDSNAYIYFEGNQMIQFSSNIISNDTFYVKFFFQRIGSTNQFFMGNSATTNDYMYVPSAGTTIELAVTGSNRAKINYNFYDGYYYFVELKRAGLATQWKVYQPGEINAPWQNNIADLTANNNSVFNRFGYRSGTAYYTGAAKYLTVYNWAGTITHDYNFNSVDTVIDLVGTTHGTLTVDSLYYVNERSDYFYYDSTDYEYNNTHLIDYGAYTNTGLGYNPLINKLISCKYDANEAYILRSNFDGTKYDSINITQWFPSGGMQGITFNTLDSTYLIQWPKGAAMCMMTISSDADGNDSTTNVTLAGAATSGSIVFDATLNGGAGGVWFHTGGAANLTKYSLLGASLGTVAIPSRLPATFEFKSAEGLWLDNSYYYLGGSYYVAVFKRTNFSLVQEYPNPANSDATGGEDEGLVYIDDWLYFNTDALTHSGSYGKNVMWKLKAEHTDIYRDEYNNPIDE